MIPGFTNNLKFNLLWLKCLREHSEWFYDNIKIVSLYGSFPNAIWNGGRCVFGNMEISEIKTIIELVNSVGVSLRHTFTNCLIEERHLEDEYCNKIMDLCNNGKNEVLINSTLLESYLRSKYPDYRYILSTTTMTRGSEAINKACMKYDMVVADYRDSIHKDFLQNIISKNKVEILLNESCIYDCRFRDYHYKEISRAQLMLKETQEAETCMYHDVSKFREAYISVDTLYNVLIPMGYTNFKIRGREMSSEKLMHEYLTYLVKPFCREFVKREIIRLLAHSREV